MDYGIERGGGGSSLNKEWNIFGVYNNRNGPP